jgi:hypothetical protein
MLRRLLTLCLASACLTLAAPALAQDDRPDPCLTAPTVPAQIDDLAAAIVAQPLEAALPAVADAASEPVFTIVAPASFAVEVAAVERACKVALVPGRITLKRPALRLLPGLLAAARQAMPSKHRLTQLLC